MIFLKGVCHDIFDLYFVHDSNPSGPLIDRLWLSCQNMKNSKNSCHTDMLYYFFMCMLIMHAFWKVVILKIESTTVIQMFALSICFVTVRHNSVDPVQGKKQFFVHYLLYSRMG